MIAELMKLVGTAAGKYVVIAAIVALLALVGTGYGWMKAHDARVVAEDRTKAALIQAEAYSAFYQASLDESKRISDAAQARVANLAATHQRIDNARPTNCPTAPDAIRAAILRNPAATAVLPSHSK